MTIILPQVYTHLWCHSTWHFRCRFPIAECGLLCLGEMLALFEIVNVSKPHVALSLPLSHSGMRQRKCQVL